MNVYRVVFSSHFRCLVGAANPNDAVTIAIAAGLAASTPQTLISSQVTGVNNLGPLHLASE